MTKSVLAIAALAAALSTAAYAGDSKPTPMTDAQMDQVTAGVEFTLDNGHTTHFVRSGADAIGPIGGVGGESVVITQNGNVIRGIGSNNIADENIGPGGGAHALTPSGLHNGGIFKPR